MSVIAEKVDKLPEVGRIRSIPMHLTPTENIFPNRDLSLLTEWVEPMEVGFTEEIGSEHIQGFLIKIQTP